MQKTKHKLGVTYYEFIVRSSDICRVTCDTQGVHKAKINKVQRNMDSKERIMEGKTELVQSVTNILFLNHFPRRTGPAPNVYTLITRAYSGTCRKVQHYLVISRYRNSRLQIVNVTAEREIKYESRNPYKNVSVRLPHQTTSDYIRRAEKHRILTGAPSSIHRQRNRV